MNNLRLLLLSLPLALLLGACKDKVSPPEDVSGRDTQATTMAVDDSGEPASDQPVRRPKRITQARIDEIKAAGRTGFWSEVTAVCPGTREQTMLTWNIPDSEDRYVVYVIDKDGEERNFGQGGAVGEKMTGPWLRPGLVFTLRSAGDKAEAGRVEIGTSTDC